MSRKLVWFRTDLRTRDNPALMHAIDSALKAHQQLIALFIVSPADWDSHAVSKWKQAFIMDNLSILSSQLSSSFGVPLLIKHADKASDVATLVHSECQRLKVDHLYFNREYEVDEGRRDRKVEELLKESGIMTSSFHDQVLVPPGVLRSKSSDTVFTVFSFFRKAWYDYVARDKSTLLSLCEPPSIPNGKLKCEIAADSIPQLAHVDSKMRKKVASMYAAGEEVAHKKLADFVESHITGYKSNRDFPAKPGTSSLSPYLASGVLSVKQCVLAALDANNSKMDTGNEGIVCWIQELIWRDFYKHILVAYPRVCMCKPFKIDTLTVPWRNDDEQFAAWKEGKTGYPIVDAGMRQLKETGWMHNRVRMIVASFLTKHLLINWMDGERHFSLNLIDCDFASNNGGWQWAASTGTDSQPYFRVFNPYLQSKKFDVNGAYIRKWVPELAKLDNTTIHFPEETMSKAAIEKLGYCPRIVQHEFARKRAIEAFKSRVLLEDETEKSSNKKRKAETSMDKYVIKAKKI
eukprot:Partr_v1_DN26245_c1_g1_i3_m48392 putative cryptochrome